jgi:ribosomal protein S27E
MHSSCYKGFIKTNIACPLCRKSVCDPKLFEMHMDIQIASMVMPPEYQNKMMRIQCNDCLHQCLVPFHIVGGKCK